MAVNGVIFIYYETDFILKGEKKNSSSWKLNHGGSCALFEGSTTTELTTSIARRSSTCISYAFLVLRSRRTI